MKRLSIIVLVLASRIVLADRGLITDRPNKTESAHTVPRNRFQLETDIMSRTVDKIKNPNVKSTVLVINNINLKYGVTENDDVQLILPNYIEQKIRSSGTTVTQKGFGDVMVRYKHNLYGNDENVALGLMPYAKLPTAGAGLSNKHVEGGIILPLNLTLSYAWDFGAQVQVDHVRRNDDSGSQTDYIMSTTVAHTIVGDLSGFVELFSKTSDNDNQSGISTLDLGVTYLWSPVIQLDAGAFIGLTEQADDLQTFAGVSALF